MLAGLLAVLAMVAFGLTGVAWAHSSAGRRSIPNSETTSPVAWGSTEDEAKERAVEACKRVSKTCANGPASTNDMDDVFAVMCCTRPRSGCAAAAGPTRREDASKSVRKNVHGRRVQHCTLRHYMSAGTGKKQ